MQNSPFHLDSSVKHQRQQPFSAPLQLTDENQSNDVENGDEQESVDETLQWIPSNDDDVSPLVVVSAD